jgi:hypothetical protein
MNNLVKLLVYGLGLAAVYSAVQADWLGVWAWVSCIVLVMWVREISEGN